MKTVIAAGNRRKEDITNTALGRSESRAARRFVDAGDVLRRLKATDTGELSSVFPEGPEVLEVSTAARHGPVQWSTSNGNDVCEEAAPPDLEQWL